jgi:hypothetical protein
MTVDWRFFGVSGSVFYGSLNLTLPIDDEGLSWNPEDTIRLNVEDGVCGAENIEFVLTSATDPEPIRWWKGLRLITTDGLLVGVSETQDNVHTGATILLDVANLADKKLELWKAKFLGVHTGMYDLDLSVLSGFGGKRFTFLWLKDNGRDSNA